MNTYGLPATRGLSELHPDITAILVESSLSAVSDDWTPMLPPEDSPYMVLVSSPYKPYAIRIPVEGGSETIAWELL